MQDSSLKSLTTERLEDARALLAAKRFSGAYYMAGYVAECALKVCVIKRIEDVTRQGFMPDKALLNQIYIHKLTELVKSADLQPQLAVAITSPTFQANWNIVTAWNETARYRSFDEQDAEDILQALTDPIDGVLPWIQQFW